MQDPRPADPNLPTIASLWIGPPLSWFEIVCIRSFQDAGHRFVLYTRGEMENIPPGVEHRQADVLTPPTTQLRDRKEISAFSNFFRFTMLKEEGFIWADLDAYCVKAFDFDTKWIFANEMRLRDQINCGILGLPQDAEELDQCIEFWQRPNPIPPWLPRGQRRKLREFRKKGIPHPIENLRWGSSGPHLIDHFLKLSGNIEHAMDRHVFYPTAGRKLPLLYTPGAPLSQIEMPETYSVHLYGETKRRLLAEHGGNPPAGSYLELICQRHGVDPEAYPITYIPTRGDGNAPSDDPAPGSEDAEDLEMG